MDDPAATRCGAGRAVAMPSILAVVATPSHNNADQRYRDQGASFANHDQVSSGLVKIGAPGGVFTRIFLVKSQTRLSGHGGVLVPADGVEPNVYRLSSGCSAVELSGQNPMILTHPSE
jgi:hypothetical protein